MTKQCGVTATFAGKQRTDNGTTGHYDGEYHWITPIPLIGPLPHHEYTDDPCPCWDD